MSSSRRTLLETVGVLAIAVLAIRPLFVFAPAYPDFGVNFQPTPAPLIIVAGTTGRAGVMFTQVGGFTGNIIVSMSITPSISNAPVPDFPYPYAELNATVPSEYNFTITTSPSTPLGLYNITATGTSGSLIHSATLTFGVSDVQVPSNGAELVYKLGFSAPAHLGTTIFLQANFTDIGYVEVAITNIVLTFDFGTYESAQGVWFYLKPLTQGPTGFAVTIPTTTSLGAHSFTATISWVLAPMTISQTQGPEIVSHGSLQVGPNNPSGLLSSLSSDLIPLLLVSIAITSVSIFLVSRHEKAKQARMSEGTPATGMAT